MGTAFDALISACRQAYAAFQQLASRTDEALYQALGQVHALRWQMRSDTALHAQFQQLLEQHAPDKSGKDTLFLVKYAYFPHTLQPGPGHKADITKASRYAKLINKALDQDVQPADFVEFARDQGVQRTAAASRRASPPRYCSGRPGRRRPPSAISSRPSTGSFLDAILSPRGVSFYSSQLLARLGTLLRAASHQAQRVSLTIYLNDERAVLTGCTGGAWRGEFPEPAIPLPTAAPERSPAAIVADGPPKLSPRAPGLPLRRRGTSVPAMPGASFVRSQSRRGHVSPAWRTRG